MMGGRRADLADGSISRSRSGLAAVRRADDIRSLPSSVPASPACRPPLSARPPQHSHFPSGGHAALAATPAAVAKAALAVASANAVVDAVTGAAHALPTPETSSAAERLQGTNAMLRARLDAVVDTQKRSAPPGRSV